MSCVYPVDAWRSAKRSESGKRGIVFNPRDGYIDQPLQVPCGKCIGCSQSRARTWGVRAYHESTQHQRNSFLTLTYADPAPVAIDKRHCQLFIKRLRRLYSVRYFLCGEYGTQTRRPHYHAVIFGEDFLAGKFAINEELYGNPILESIWGYGHVSVGSVTIESCMYVAGYVNKKSGDPDTFNLMSRRPGIGHTWLDKYKDDIKNTEIVVIEGQEYAIPKSYLTRYETEFQGIKNKRISYYKNMTGEQIVQKRQQLKAKEIQLKSKQSLVMEKI